MKIAILEQEIKGLILELLRPWNYCITNADEADIVIARGDVSSITERAIIIPSESEEFGSFVKSNHFGHSKKETGQQVQVPVTENLALTITPESLYAYGISRNCEHSKYAISIDDSPSVLKIDIVAEYYRILNETFNAKPSARYRLFTLSLIHI